MLATSGPISNSLSYLRDTIAGSATFRTLCGAANAAAAKRHIYYHGLNEPKAWAATTAYVLGEFVRLAAEDAPVCIYECTVAGTSDATEPTWPTTVDDTVVDDSVTWTARTLYNKDPYMSMVRARRPFALVSTSETFNLSHMAMGISNEFEMNGAHVLYLEFDVPAAYTATNDEAGIWIANQVGNIIDDMCVLAGAVGYLDITGFDLVTFARAPIEDRQDIGDCCQVELNISYQGIP